MLGLGHQLAGPHSPPRLAHPLPGPFPSGPFWMTLDQLLPNPSSNPSFESLGLQASCPNGQRSIFDSPDAQFYKRLKNEHRTGTGSNSFIVCVDGFNRSPEGESAWISTCSPSSPQPGSQDAPSSSWCHSSGAPEQPGKLDLDHRLCEHQTCGARDHLPALPQAFPCLQRLLSCSPRKILQIL